ncbi:hypothetical protein BN14_11302 [Rhizoctonia solani AG-1 IB]|uniref:Uncharacterized protein n=1 Tax=Thanatephorus cucumeris (strain AG1-IB / isolate 7/3/14) TaxID=1108050 RepID=M5CDF9_THACB|nr:hypothetical protein BN14_11302 [Rhizoctonia solani AG-1 IB]
MSTTISHANDGWYVNSMDSGSPNQNNPPSDDPQPTQRIPVSSNSLGLQLSADLSVAHAVLQPVGSTSLDGIAYCAASPHPSRYIHALTNDMFLTGQRQRLQKSSSSSSGEDGDLLHTQESRTRPTMLLTALHTAPVATQGLALVRPVQSNTLALVRPGRNSSVAPAPLLQATVGDNHNVSSYADAMSTGDDEVVESLYEEPRRGNVADLRELCELVNKLLEDQAKLSHDIKQIDTRTQQMTANQQNGSNRPNRDGNYVSPPEPVLEINWDQTVQHDAPAGRRRRAKRRVLLMALIRETIF